ncbi:hypothetical protein IJ182_01250 [bacterium]|nr:hypothetical protein [bacterium]
MTVSSVSPVNNYTGNSSNTRFDFDFLIEKESELVVQHTDKNGVISILQYGIDYSIHEIGNKNGSYIIFPLNNSQYPVLKEEEGLSLMLDLVIKQENEFRNSLYYNIEVIEWTYDYIIRILQILSRKIERCVKVVEGSESTPDMIIDELNSAKNVAVVSAQNASNSAQNASNSAQTASGYVNDALIYAQNSANSAQDAENVISVLNTKKAEFLQEYEQCLENIRNSGINTFGTIALDNLSTAGEKHFLNKMQISNCILEAPNGVFTYIGSTITISSGLKVLIPNGKNNDGTLTNIEYTVTSDISDTPALDVNKYVFVNKNGTIYYASNYYVSDIEPTSSVTNDVWYSPFQNKTFKRNMASFWENIPLVCLGVVMTNRTYMPYKPVTLVTVNDIDGQWVPSYYGIVTSSVSLHSSDGDLYYSLDSYLPKDGNKYEVILRGLCATGSTSGHIISIQVTTSALGNNITLARAQTRSSSNVTSGGSAIVPVGTDRLLTVVRDSGWNGNLNSLYAIAYRKVR